MRKSNKQLGNIFEKEFCEILSKKGYWVHNLVQNASGQPADIIAVRNGNAYLIDCKVCTNDKFALSRIEENQYLAMNLWEECGNKPCLFAFKTSDGIYIIDKHKLLETTSIQSTLSIEDIKRQGDTLEKVLA